jgi:hypothetical protein
MFPVTVPIDTAEVSDRERVLTSGTYGDSRLIRDRADAWYARAGLPAGSGTRGDLHPWVEHLAEQASLGSAWDGTVQPIPPVRVKSILDVPTPGLRADAEHAPEFLLELEERLGEKVEADLPNEDSLALRAAMGMLLAECPTLATDALGFARLVLVTGNEQVVGQTWTDMVGLMVIGRRVIRDRSLGSDSVFHESLHSKMATIDRGLKTTFLDEPELPTRIEIPWRSGEGENSSWTTFRVFDAYYVYAHLTVLWSARVLRTRREEDPCPSTKTALDRLRRLCFRAEFLSNQLQLSGFAHLDEERIALLQWLDRIRVPAFGISEAGRSVLTTPAIRE